MPKTATPAIPQTPNLGVPGVLLTTAMTTTKAFDGTEAVGTSMALILTAGADGDRIDSLRVKYSGTVGAVPSGTTNQLVIRVWANNGSVNTTAANNIFLTDQTINAQPMATADTAAIPDIVVPINTFLPIGYRLYAGITKAIGGTNCALAVSANDAAL